MRRKNLEVFGDKFMLIHATPQMPADLRKMSTQGELSPIRVSIIKSDRLKSSAPR
jgi:hypothetical protein